MKITELLESKYMITDRKTQKKFKTSAEDGSEAKKKGVAKFGHSNIAVSKLD